MYSKIPMPRVEWQKENMKYALCFFPLVGTVIGTILILWEWICYYLGFNTILFAAVASYLPILITGGIHMDGYCDTIDGLSSNQSQERKIEILSDPHAGAFAIIKTCGYFLLYFAVFTQLDQLSIGIVACSYTLSRILSAIAVIHFKSAKTGGLLYEFKDKASRQIVSVVLSIMMVLLMIFMLKINIILGIASAITSLLVFLYYRMMSYQKFGGITGDLAGYFVQLCELWIPITIIVVQGILK